MTVQALFVDTKTGPYPGLLGLENCWGETRDARLYNGPNPVVAHPPCHLWVNMAAVNYRRATAECPQCGADPEYIEWCTSCGGTGRREPNRAIVLPAWYPGGDDGGCFASALASVRKYGGVLEHPAGSHAWKHHGLRPPKSACHWTAHVHRDLELQWVCEVWQSAYGHAARKRTWLLYCGKQPPFELNWERKPGTHQVGWFDRNKPTLSKKAASRSPVEFAKELIKLAEWSKE